MLGTTAYLGVAHSPLRLAVARMVMALVLVLSMGGVLTGGVGCIGNAARDHAGVPALTLADDGVIANARSGLATLPDDQQAQPAAKLDAFAAALASKDRAVIVAEAFPRWTVVRSLADFGITAREERGEIGPGVAASLRERLANFEETLLKVGAAP